MGWFKKALDKGQELVTTQAKETLNDKLDQYSGLIKVGLSLAVILFGASKITPKNSPTGKGNAPVINQYFYNGREGGNWPVRK